MVFNSFYSLSFLKSVLPFVHSQVTQFTSFLFPLTFFSVAFSPLKIVRYLFLVIFSALLFRSIYSDETAVDLLKQLCHFVNLRQLSIRLFVIQQCNNLYHDKVNSFFQL